MRSLAERGLRTAAAVARWELPWRTGPSGMLLLALFLCVGSRADGHCQAVADSTGTDKLASLEGHVTNAITGEPLRKASVKLISAGATTSPAGSAAGFTIPASPAFRSAISDAEGVFRFENVPPGRYDLAATRVGFLASNHRGNKSASARSTVMLEAGQRITSLTVMLLPQSAISGKVVDEDGDPLDGGFVTVTARMWVKGQRRYLIRNSCPINDLGDFRCGGLAPGSYYLSAEARPEGPQDPLGPPAGQAKVKPVRTYYPSAPSLANATAIDLLAGQDAPGMNIKVLSAPTFHVRGKIVNKRSDLQILISTRGDEALGVFTGNHPSEIKNDGTFDIAEVTPGAYVVSAFTMSDNGELGVVGHREIDVSSSDVNDVVLTLVSAGKITGHVVNTATRPQAATSDDNTPRASVSLIEVNSSMFITPNLTAQVNTDGGFAFEKVPPGTYRVATSCPPGAYLSSVLYGQREILEESLDLTAGVNGEVNLTCKAGAAAVEGTLQLVDADQKTRQGVDGRVILLAESQSGFGSEPHMVRPDTAGRFSFKDLAPGRYRAFAFEEVDLDQIQNPDLRKLLDVQGVSVELNDRDKKQIQLPLISTDALNQMVQRSGIDSQ